MLPRPLFGFGLVCLATLPLLTLGGCSSKLPRDQYYGTDAGANYQVEAASISSPPDDDASPADELSDDTADALSAQNADADAGSE